MQFQDFTLDMYFRQFWQDPRLSFSEPGLEKLVVGAEYIKLIWVPDTFFVNEKSAYFHDATTENQFLRILHTGEILRSIRWVVPNHTRALYTEQFIWQCRSGYNSINPLSNIKAQKYWIEYSIQFGRTLIISIFIDILLFSYNYICSCPSVHTHHACLQQSSISCFTTYRFLISLLDRIYIFYQFKTKLSRI